VRQEAFRKVSNHYGLGAKRVSSARKSSYNNLGHSSGITYSNEGGRQKYQMSTSGAYSPYVATKHPTSVSP